MKIDRFSIVVIVIVVTLITAAVIAVNRADSGNVDDVEYLANDTPDAPVQNAFLALQEGAISKARAQYSAEIADDNGSNYGQKPWSGENFYYDRENASRRLRILTVEIDEADLDQALVTFTLDTYRRNNGLFGAGATWSSQRTVEVVREDDEWKLNAPEFFY